MNEVNINCKKRNLPMTFGIVLSVIWIILMVFLAFYGECRSFFSLTLNEQGDFLAGAAAPLAFGWLVLGYFQQSRELRMQATELTNQTRELRNTVDQHKELVEINQKLFEYTTRKDEAEKQQIFFKSQPIFQFISLLSTFHATRSQGESVLGNIQLDISKTGADIKGIVISLVLCEIDGTRSEKAQLKGEKVRYPLWKTGDREVVVQLPRDSYGKTVSVYLEISYEDAERLSRSMFVKIVFSKDTIIENPRSIHPIPAQ